MKRIIWSLACLLTFGSFSFFSNLRSSLIPILNSERRTKTQDEIRTNKSRLLLKNQETEILESARAQKHPSEIGANELELLELDRKLLVLEEILKSKEDNDPRLDTEFKNLSSTEKKAIQAKYDQLKPEALNERGTLVFLLGRELRSADDFQFLKKVLQEPVCYQLNHCKAKESLARSHDDSGATELTLAYPQILALKSIEPHLDDPAFNHEVDELIETALASKNLRIQTLAQQLKRQFNP